MLARSLSFLLSLVKTPARELVVSICLALLTVVLRMFGKADAALVLLLGLDLVDVEGEGVDCVAVRSEDAS